MFQRDAAEGVGAVVAAPGAGDAGGVEALDLGAVVRGTSDLLHRLVPERVEVLLQPTSEPLPVA